MIKLFVDDSHTDVVQLVLAGRLDVAGVQDIERDVLNGVDNSSKALVLDLEKVNFISSLGIGLLLRVAKRLRASGREMVLLRPNEIIEIALNAAWLHDILQISHDFDKAIEALSSHGGDVDA